MRTSIPTLGGLALACAFALSGATYAQNDTGKAEGTDPQAGLKTLQKEIGAANDGAKRACARRPASERDACLRKARQTWQDDMKAAPAQLQAAGGMGSVTTTRTTTVGDNSTTSATTTPATAEPGVR